MWLWINSTSATNDQKTTAHLEVFKTTASVAVMLGGIGALYLAARRQRTQEAEHTHAVRIAEVNTRHAERVATATEDDAARRRVTELYTKAADQLGSDKAPVRLAGLYALERVGQDNPDQRQTIASLWCAYLRMPYTPPPAPLILPSINQRPAGIPRPLLRKPGRRIGIRHQDLKSAVPSQPTTAHAEAVLERDVRLTVQRLLVTHLRPGRDSSGQPHRDYWAEIPDINLLGATLIDLDLSFCTVPTINLERANFIGKSGFMGSIFTGSVRFSGATFNEPAVFDDVAFRRAAWFNGATFMDDAIFNNTAYNSHVRFDDVVFSGTAWFFHAKFDGDASFDYTTFNAPARFDDADFKSNTRFDNATFNDDAWFNQATFVDARFDNATFNDSAIFNSTAFAGDALFIDATFNDNTQFEGVDFAGNTQFEDTTFNGDTLFNQATFTGNPPFNQTIFNGNARFNGTTFNGEVDFAN